MKLIHKNFLYTSIVTGILTVLVLGYFVLMLPSLYVDYMTGEYFDSILQQHRGYLKDGTYENVTVKNPGCMTLDIPFQEDSFAITGKGFHIKITPATKEMKELYSEIKEYVKAKAEQVKSQGKEPDQNEFDEKIKIWKKELEKQQDFLKQFPVTIQSTLQDSFETMYRNESTRTHYISKDTIVIGASVEDGENHYTNYIGITYKENRLVVSVLSTMTPQMNEITPIVLHSLPMLLAVIILFALVVSYLYSKGIVNPILRLVKHTQAVKNRGNTANAALPVEGKDEISILVQTLNELYKELDNNYKNLKLNKEELEKKNKSQEVFLRSSSHQLKTPIAAGLLLVDGMINQIGKYKDVEKYLPEVKKQMLSMRKIVEEILSLSRREENLTREEVDLNLLLSRQLSSYQIPFAENNCRLETKFAKESKVTTDAFLLVKIVDNLISNAINHSKQGSAITVSTGENFLEIRNSPAHISEELLPNIFEPFVSSHSKGHGLGLYIVSYYADLLGAKIVICNESQSVLARLSFPTIYITYL